MKCIRDEISGEITRVSDEEAAECMVYGAYEYVPKSEWKAATRGAASQGGQTSDG